MFLNCVIEEAVVLRTVARFRDLDTVRKLEDAGAAALVLLQQFLQTVAPAPPPGTAALTAPAPVHPQALVRGKLQTVATGCLQRYAAGPGAE